MSDPSKSAPAFSFGQPATSGGSSGSLFGSNTPAQGSTSIFGSSSQNKPATSSGASLFGGGSGQTTPATSGPSLFGSTTPNTQGSIFGSGSTTAAFGSGNTGTLFGQNPSSTTPSSGFSFGKKPEENANQTSSSNTGMNQAGTPATPGQGPSAAGTSGASPFSSFGTPATAKPSAFFSPNTSTTPAGPPPTSSVGSASVFSGFGKPQQSSNALFGQTKTQPETAQSNPSTLFGGGSSTIPSTTNNLFGAKPPDSQQPASGSSATSTLFGSKPTENQQASASSGPAPSSQPTGGFFGGLNKTSSGQSTPGFGNLGSTQQNQGSKSGFGFLGSSSAPSQTPAAQPTAPVPTSNLFNAGVSTSSSTPSTSSAAPATNLFGATTNNPASTAASTAAPTTSFFSTLGQKKDNAATSSTPASSSTATTSTAAPTNTLFGQKKDDTTTTTAAAAATSTNAPTTTPAPAAPSAPTTFTGVGTAPKDASTTLGASTTGPAPPASSRLKNKSMDEIITRWATDLSKHQKQFQAQAGQVAEWDAMLVENSDRISKLYARTFQAERDTAEVERRLSAVEGQQEELGAWLERYEREVEGMMGRSGGVGQGGGEGAVGAGGPDGEREKTYRLAERLNDKLGEMGRELGTMIEDINGVSGQLSRTSRADDPVSTAAVFRIAPCLGEEIANLRGKQLSQIVRVLNSHLFSLQQIDQSATQLQTKVAAAQKDTQRMGTNGYHGIGSDPADDFYRSWMGSRR
ncbi:MAG: hypothetical protein Q9165_003707 [Trypethelium subeluteriae]